MDERKHRAKPFYSICSERTKFRSFFLLSLQRLELVYFGSLFAKICSSHWREGGEVSLFSWADPMEEVTETNAVASVPKACTGKPPMIPGVNFPVLVSASSSMPLSASVSAQDFRCLDLEIKEAAEESSPRCVLDDGSSRGSDSAMSSLSSLMESTSYAADTQRDNSSTWKGFFRLWRRKSMRRLSSFPPFGVPKALSRKRSNRDAPGTASESPEATELPFFRPSWKNLTLSELRSATNNFSPENIIGRGGFAEVYKGCLEDGQLVAVKRLTQGSADERTINFLSELGVIVHVDHPNIAKLVGVGVEGGMHLVFQLSVHGSLEGLLHGSENKPDWGVRYKIALGVAKGLEYLHEKCPRRIIHRDIKAANIFITDDFEPQIGDFGLAKWLPDKMTYHTSSCFEGTFGYLAPEYCMHGIVDEKTDVFSFGVLMLELVTGRRALNSSQQSLVMWAKPLLEENNMKELIDPYLDDSYEPMQMTYVAQTAYMCIQHSSALRPRISQVLQLLKGEEGRSEIAKAVKRSFLRRTYSEELLDAEEYNATRYLSDLRRHKQIALDF